MYSQSVIVQSQNGLHAKAAGDFVQKANKFISSVSVEVDGRSINAKSMLGLLSLGIYGGTDMMVVANGTDEREAVAELIDMVTNLS